MYRLLFSLLVFTGCAHHAAPCPPQAPVSPPPATSPPTAVPAGPPGKKLAVLPLDDGDLFRSERAALRTELASRLAMLLPHHDLVPLTEVDRALRPLSKTAKRCAYEGAPPPRKAAAHGWFWTSTSTIYGARGKMPELAVDIHRGQEVSDTFTATWDEHKPLVARYDQAFATLEPTADQAGMLGSLLSSGPYPGAVEIGGLTLCERERFWKCKAHTKAWRDVAARLTGCFLGRDEGHARLLVEGRRCELPVDDTGGREGTLERCLCGAAMASAGIKAAPGRRRLYLDYQAKDIVGRPRPELRLVEASSNLHAEHDWHSIASERNGRKIYHSVQRLTVDNLDALAPALARCTVAGPTLAELTIDSGGHVTSAQADDACVKKQLARGAFDCTDDGKTARATLAIYPPPEAKRPR